MDPTSDPPATTTIKDNVTTGDVGHIEISDNAIGPKADPTWLVTMPEKGRGFWLGPGEPPPPAHLKPGEYMDVSLAPQIAILLHSVCVGDGWTPEVRVTGPGCETVPSLKAVERLGDQAQRWEIQGHPIEVGPKSVMTQIHLRLINRSVETRTERDAVLMRMPHLAVRGHSAAICDLLQVASARLLDAANRARLANMHELADAIMAESKLVEILTAHKDLRAP